MRPELETYSVPTGSSSERDVPFTFGFHYRCSNCSARSYFFRPGVLVFFGIATLVTLVGALSMEPTLPYGWHQRSTFRFVFSPGNVPAWLRCVLVLAIPLALLGYDQWQRYRNPPAR